jgi:hypothetical protein
VLKLTPFAARKKDYYSAGYQEVWHLVPLPYH